MTSGSTDSPRTLADELRARSDEELSELLRARPDLLSPLPGDLSQLATRAGARPSVLRALEHLDTFTLQTAEALAIAERPCSQHALGALLAGGESRLPQALATLRARALLWGRPDALRLVRTAQELLAPTPGRPSATGLGPTLAETASGIAPSRMQQLVATCGLPPTRDPVSAVAALTALFRSPERLAALLAEAPPGARAALDRLTWGPPFGTMGSGAEAARSGTPLRWLLDRGLLMPTGPGSVVLPREVALELRGGRVHRELRPEPPELTAATTHAPSVVDAAAAGAAHRALDTVEELLTSWNAEGPPVLRAGGLGLRELKRIAVGLDVPEPEAVFWLELAYGAGLLASDGEADERYAPTPRFDVWLEAPTGDRWLPLVTAWLAGTRVPGLVGTRDGKGRLLAVLGTGLDRGAAPALRHRTLELVGELPPGGAPSPTAVANRLGWELPRRVGEETRAQLCAAALADAERLGVTGRGALASFARPLLAQPPDPTAAAMLLAPLFPEPVDQVLLQADLTAIAPGPLRRDLRATMALAAEIESTGGATVYRFTPGSIRRALDAGWSTGELHAFLARVSRTPVPQPLDYLVDDVARRHGRLRVGAAASYLRCEDETTIGQLLADRGFAALRLRRIAPTVLVSDLAPDALLGKLRELGQAPAAETAEGDVVTLGGEPHRAPARTAPAPAPDTPPPADETLLTSAVRAVRAGDHASGAAPEAPPGARVPEAVGPPPRTSPEESLAALRAAAASGGLVRIGYVGSDGTASHHVLAPVRVAGGFVTGFDHTAEEVRTYPLHRITGTAPAT
ncbi:helicase-associated domain-containing protein [Streptomyces profundus]|uniref:helicase-associated domain-containing protein n=1 Tax=Streptomyces profundus TaxID=2867410 RepID=UPI001D164C31|nr:helicase-associated domain-containing protein [Streptomyces sp. MA3_2.13]UED85716.1 helicase-associated domain-containing protein [Streptomyces sp. MA3_2.13]